MHPYLPHLLADITAAHRPETKRDPGKRMSFEEEMEEIERWVEGEEAEHTFGYYCGLEAVNFPPARTLTVREMKQVLRAFQKMMFSWNAGIDLPASLPIDIAYSMTVDTLNTPTTIVNSGCMHFDFCSGDAPGCIFKEYCPCLKIWNTDDNNPGVHELSDTDNLF